MSHMWGCGLCPSGLTTDAIETPEGWHVVECIPLCPQHDHTDNALAAILRHFPRYWKMSSAGGMYWLTEASCVTIDRVTAYTSPYQAVLAWARERAGL